MITLAKAVTAVPSRRLLVAANMAKTGMHKEPCGLRVPTLWLGSNRVYYKASRWNLVSLWIHEFHKHDIFWDVEYCILSMCSIRLTGGRYDGVGGGGMAGGWLWTLSIASFGAWNIHHNICDRSICLLPQQCSKVWQLSLSNWTTSR